MSVEVRVEPTPTPQTFHWVNVFVGILDSTFHLLEEEQFFTAAIIQELLESLHVDDRPAPEKLPSPLALELASEFYSLGLVKTRDVSVSRSVHEAHPATPAPSVTAWAQAFVSMLHVAYPDLDPLELFQADKVFTDILVSLGVPRRAALHTPDDVLRSYQATDVEP